MSFVDAFTDTFHDYYGVFIPEPDEETRAQMWRDEQRARAINKNVAERALRGDPARARTVHQSWEPLHRFDRHGVPIIGHEDDPC